MADVKSLQRIFHIREFVKDERELEVKKILQMLRAEEDKLRKLNEALNDSIQALDNKKNSSSTNIHEITLYYNFIDRLYKEIDNQTKMVVAVMIQLQKAEDALREAYKEMKIVEKLRDKRIHEEDKRKSKSFQKMLDFQFIARLGRD